MKSSIWFNNRRQTVQAKLRVPGHPEKRPVLCSYRDLEILGLTENTASRVTEGVYIYSRDKKEKREKRIDYLTELLEAKKDAVALKFGNPSSALTIEELINKWTEEVYPKLKKPTATPSHHRFWIKKLGSERCADINHFTINRILSELETEGSAQSTINTYLGNLSRVFNWAVKIKGWLSFNPCKNAQWRSVSRRLNFLTREEFALLVPELKASRNANLYDAAMLAVLSGSRKNELLGLRWRQVDFKNRRVQFIQTKNGTPRSVSCGEQAFKILEKRAKVRRIDDDRVFISNGEGVSSYLDGFKNAIKRAGIERNVVWHDMRHTCASWLAEAGFSLLEIGQHLGHKSYQSTLIYAHLVDEHTKQTAKALDHAVNF